MEVKWSDRFAEDPSKLTSLRNFCGANNVTNSIVTTISQRKDVQLGALKLNFVPASLYALTLGTNIIGKR